MLPRNLTLYSLWRSLKCLSQFHSFLCYYYLLSVLQHYRFAKAQKLRFCLMKLHVHNSSWHQFLLLLDNRISIPILRKRLISFWEIPNRAAMIPKEFLKMPRITIVNYSLIIGDVSPQKDLQLLGNHCLKQKVP